ncbi:hypothetical protein KL86DES1_20094 [uncultured Desulfovibrio sp.]|uniref:Uncharacterized protein n=1 Tax=uncultured Desulfovibrio sp. TaxID=167968 RepID=A0A212L261_9BACT|nr:hypothetical protein KL86DES1_20094 [uncultured Desulfovibrio sp.]VZH32994.1 conserved protein of unknown function [Desulfovibrio sp. 86]
MFVNNILLNVINIVKIVKKFSEQKIYTSDKKTVQKDPRPSNPPRKKSHLRVCLEP